MQILKAIVDTQRTNTTIGYVNTGDVVKLNLQVISNGEIGDNWVNPVIELHGIKSDKKRVRQTDNIQIVDLANHHLEITLHEQFMTCDGLVRLQLVIKDDGGRISGRRISSSVFYLRVTKSLEMGVMESHDYIQVFDDFDTYMELVKEFEAKMKEDITLLEAEIQKASDLSQSISKNEAERQEAFEMNESNREVQFNASQSSQTSTFTTNEAERQKGETQRVANENARQTAERNREVRMAELETKTSELIEKADEQVLKVDEFINANTKQLLEEDARKDYMGNECRSIRETMNSNVDYAVKTAIGEFNYLDYEGQHITANNSIEGHVKSAILKGSTLVNCIIDSSRNGYITIGGNMIDDEGWLTIGATSGNNHFELAMDNLNIKPSTKYLLVIECESNSFQGHNHNMSIGNTYQNVIDSPWVENLQIKMLPVGISTYMLTTKSDFSILNNPIGCRSYVGVGTGTTKFRYMIIEYQEGMEHWDIPYFEGMQSVRIPVLTTTGKNLLKYSMDNVYTNSSKSDYTPVLNEDGSITLNSCYDEPYWLRKGFYVEKGKNYTVTVTGMKNEDQYSALCFGFDNLKYWDGGAGKALIVTSSGKNCINTIGTYGTQKITCTALETGYITRFYIHSSFLTTKFTILEFQIEEGSVATAYEPFKTNILTTPSDLELRGIGEVKDELNLLTGELTQRIGEIVLDGSEGWSIATEGDTTNGFSIYTSITDRKLGANVLCEQLPVYRYASEVTGKTNFILAFTGQSKVVVVNIANKTTKEEAIAHLKQNPIKLQIVKEPSIKTVVLSDNVVYSYDEVAHYDCSSEDGSLIPTVAVKVPTDVNAVISSQRATIQEQTEQINTLEKENTLLTEQNEKQDVDIALNQDAINFMLFEVMGLSNDDANKLNPMAIYFANQILKGKLTYTQVIGKYPQFKDNIDSCLLAEGRSDLIVKID